MQKFQKPKKIHKENSNMMTPPTTFLNPLEERAFLFAKQVRRFVKMLPKTITHLEDVPQLVRSSGSIGANYIEANECLGSKDFLHRLRIARKEAKESFFWLRLLEPVTSEQSKLRDDLCKETQELRAILSTIIIRSAGKIKKTL
jgi:four helix bundle protein